jgi:hypothetical protein
MRYRPTERKDHSKIWLSIKYVVIDPLNFYLPTTFANPSTTFATSPSIRSTP